MTIILWDEKGVPICVIKWIFPAAGSFWSFYPSHMVPAAP